MAQSQPFVSGGSTKGLTRDMELARNAWQSRSTELSKLAHQGGSVRCAEGGHQQEGALIKSIVFGGLDGILTTFAIVSGATGGGYSAGVILILGFSSKVADALAMGLGDALSSKAEMEHIHREREREFWEFDNYPEGEVMEMIDLYEKQGMSREDAELVVRLMSEHRDFFVDIMMIEELGLLVPGEDENPWFDGFVTFCSFIFFGFFPLLGYCIFPFAFPSIESQTLFLVAFLLTGCTLFVLGSIKGLFSVKTWYYSGFEMLIIGYLVCFIAYAMGSLTSWFIGVDVDTLGQ